MYQFIKTNVHATYYVLHLNKHMF